MTTKIIDLRHFDLKARRIKSQTSKILTERGLLPRFNRWRLTQDPDTGMVVLFGVLNHNYIAAHSSTPFSDYFDPRLLHEMANDLQVQIVSCNGSSLRYAFVLDRGQFEKLPTHIDFPYVDNGNVSVRMVYNDQPLPVPVPVQPINSATPDDILFLRQVTRAFLKVFEDIKLKDDAVLLLASQNPPDIAIIDETEFRKRVLEHEVNRQRVKRISKMLDNAVG